MDHYAIAPRAWWHDQRLNGSMVLFTAWWHSTGAPQVRGNVDGPSDQGPGAPSSIDNPISPGGVERAFIDDPVGHITTDRVLSDDVYRVLHGLCDQLAGDHPRLVARRAHMRDRFREGYVGFPEGTSAVRKGNWRVDPAPKALWERRVELLGGTSRAELVRGLNAGAKSYIADLWNFTDADPWVVLRGLRNVERAAQRELSFLHPRGGRERVDPRTTTRLMLAPRPLFVLDAQLDPGSEPVPAGFIDLAHLVVTSGAVLAERQGGVFLYLRDVQGHLEARCWARAIALAEELSGLPRGTVRATVLIDSVAGALEADEILFELVHHSAGLAIDPQGYAADHIALFSSPEGAVMPDREHIAMNAPFLRALSLHTIATCHRRGCHAMGAPSFVLPPLEATREKAAYLEMLTDKEREAVDGHDGALVIDPATVNAAMAEYNKAMPMAHQIDYVRQVDISAADLVRRPEGPITVEGLVGLVRTALRWLAPRASEDRRVVQGGRLHDRSSVRLAVRLLWQWRHSVKGVVSATGLPVNDDLIIYLVRKEAVKLFAAAHGSPAMAPESAARQLLDLVLREDPPAAI